MVLAALAPLIAKNLKKRQTENFEEKASAGGSVVIVLWYIVNFVVGIYALYLSFQRNNGLDIGSLLAACCYPWCYVAYALAVQVPSPRNASRNNVARVNNSSRTVSNPSPVRM